MNKKGFTLIELLAVIVILAIILLIAVPMVFNTIEKSKKASFEITAERLVVAGESARLTNRLNNVDGQVIYSFDGSGKIVSEPEGASKLEIKIPANTEGYLIVHEDGEVELLISDGKYLIEKSKSSPISPISEYDGEELVYYEEPPQVTTGEDVWLINGVDDNDGYMTLAPAINSNNYDFGSSYSTSLGGVSIDAIDHEGNTYYLIRTESQFNAIRSDLNGRYIQMNNITITNPLTPIGSEIGAEWRSEPFTGYYNGRNRELTINSMDTTYAGSDWALFPKTDGATLKALNVIYPNGFYAGSPLNRGGLVANALNTVIKNSSVRVSVGEELSGTSSLTIGGLVGIANNTQIIDSYFYGGLEIEIFNEDASIGGIVGKMENSSLVERTYAVSIIPEEASGLPIEEYLNNRGPGILIGGIVGEKDDTSIFRQGYYNSTTHEFINKGFGTPKTEQFLKDINNFPEFSEYMGA